MPVLNINTERMEVIVKHFYNVPSAVPLALLVIFAVILGACPSGSRSEPPADTTELEALLEDAAEKKVNVVASDDGSDVPPNKKWVPRAVFDALLDSIAAADKLVGNKKATQAQVDSALAALNDALDDFHPASVSVNKVALSTARTQAITKKTNVLVSADGLDVQPVYTWVTQEALDDFEDAIAEAEAVLYNANATQSQVSGAVSALNAAIAAFNPVAPDISRTALLAAISAANTKKTGVAVSATGADIQSSQTWVTQAALDTLNAAILAAGNVDANPNATQALLNSATATLTTAIAAFQPAAGTQTQGTVIVTFDSNGGTAVAPAVLPENTSVAEPAAPSWTITASADLLKAIKAPGVYPASVPQSAIFAGWYKDGVVWNFDTGIVTGNITLKAEWSLDSRITSVTQNSISAALSHAGSNSSSAFIAAIDTNTTVAGVTSANLTGRLTLIGLGEERVITYSGTTGRMFHLGANAQLTLANNITLRGRGTASSPHGEASIIRLDSSSTLRMQDGSKISGHIASNGYGIAVQAEGGSVFYMEGGEISGNQTTSASSWAAGGVNLASNSTFIMTGGVIKDNIGPCHDIYINETLTKFSMAGQAVIKRIILNYSTSYVRPAAMLIGSNWTGHVEFLFFRNGTNNWENKVIIGADTGHTITSADISKFLNIRDWASGTDGVPMTLYYIPDSGPDIGKLIAK